MGQSSRRPTLTQGASLVALLIQNPPAIQEPQVRSLGLEDPLEKGTATHFPYSCLENPMDRGAWGGSLSKGEFNFYFPLALPYGGLPWWLRW